MAYATGIASSFGDIKTAIETMATGALGWSTSNGVLVKNGAYIKLTEETNYTRDSLRVQGGTGETSGVLTGAPTTNPGLWDSGGAPISWPVTYHIHGFDDVDEIYCAVNYNTEYWQFLVFGVGTEAGVGGTGCWFGATYIGYIITSAAAPSSNGAAAYYTIGYSSHFIAGGANSHMGNRAPLWQAGGDLNATLATCAIHHGLDGGGWLWPTKPGNDTRSGYLAALLAGLPSPLNEAHVLLPIKAIMDRPDNGRTILKQHKHARYTRNDNLDPGEIITYGMDKWKVYPLNKKDGAQRDGGNNVNNSGTFAIAIRYDGS